MRYASSMRYGGDLVDAAECDYEDYKYLGLLCPECKDAVFLRASGSRIVKGKEVKVGAHFCHFPGKDASLVAQCENRVSGYSPQELRRRATQARGQRLKLLQRYFRDLLKLNYRFKQGIRTWNELKAFGGHGGDRLFASIEMEMREESQSNLRQNLQSKILQEIVDWAVDSKARWALRMNEDHLTLFLAATKGHEVLRFLAECDVRMHKEICKEVFGFLAARKSNSFYLLLDASQGLSETIYEIPEEWLKFGISSSGGLTDLMMAVDIITSIPWADEFAKLQKTSDRIAS